MMYGACFGVKNQVIANYPLHCTNISQFKSFLHNLYLYLYLYL